MDSIEFNVVQIYLVHSTSTRETIYHFVHSSLLFLSPEQLNFSISRLVKTPDSDDEDNNNTYEHQNHHRIQHEQNGKMSPHSELTSSCKDSCTKSRSRSSSRSRCASRSCSVSSPELEVDSPPPPPLPLRINDSSSTTNLFQVRHYLITQPAKVQITDENNEKSFLRALRMS